MMSPTARGLVPARAFAVLVLALAPFIGRAEHPPGKTNRLASTSSAYLQQHARNPVDWHPWGPEAIERARRENKPIFLSIGYSACYWCHVANWTLYEDPEVARLMNRWFVNVKVDREERPDLDRVYLRATRLMTGGAGWPNNLFLTPELKPFYAGSYWPRDDDDAGRPGFLSVMRRVHEEWTTRERGAREKSEKVAVALRSDAPPAAGARADPSRWRRAARDALLKDADLEHGGFRIPSGAKFPQAPALELLLAEGAGDAQAHAHLARTLEAMALGGLHDQLGGGFHRYTLDEGWTIPHFEKMLVDNAQLLALYARAFRATGRPLYRDVARSTAAFLLRELADPGGGFHVSLDAATGRKEGTSYLWSHEEIRRVLGPEASRRFLAAYELELVAVAGEDALVGEERRVLRVRLPFSETLARTGFRDLDALFAGLAGERARLFQARSRRVQPARDPKILVGANGLAIEGFTVSAAALRAPRHLEFARAAAERIWRGAYDPAKRILARQLVAGRPVGEGFLEDYALLARGYLALHEATGDARWRARAAALADAVLQRFLRPDGRLASTRDDVGLFVSADEHEDYVHPSGPSAALDVFLRLGEPRFSAAAGRILGGLAARVAARPERWPALAAAAPRAASLPSLALAPAAAGNVAAADPEWPTSANRVNATAVARTAGAEDALRIELAIARGWHLNANPASYAYLIPTEVAIEGITPLRVRYPASMRFAPRFVPEAIDVFEGRVVIEAFFAKGALAHRDLVAQIKVQACSDTVCLPPETVAVPVSGMEAPQRAASPPGTRTK
jgi:uncharacterized protein YyaL (SSP411 family)